MKMHVKSDTVVFVRNDIEGVRVSYRSSGVSRRRSKASQDEGLRIDNLVEPVVICSGLVSKAS